MHAHRNEGALEFCEYILPLAQLFQKLRKRRKKKIRYREAKQNNWYRIRKPVINSKVT